MAYLGRRMGEGKRPPSPPWRKKKNFLGNVKFQEFFICGTYFFNFLRRTQKPYNWGGGLIECWCWSDRLWSGWECPIFPTFEPLSRAVHQFISGKEDILIYYLLLQITRHSDRHTSCIAIIQTVLMENFLSQRSKRSSSECPNSSITRALYLPHGPK